MADGRTLRVWQDKRGALAIPVPVAMNLSFKFRAVSWFILFSNYETLNTHT